MTFDKIFGPPHNVIGLLDGLTVFFVCHRFCKARISCFPGVSSKDLSRFYRDLDDSRLETAIFAAT